MHGVAEASWSYLPCVSAHGTYDKRIPAPLLPLRVVFQDLHFELDRPSLSSQSEPSILPDADEMLDGRRLACDTEVLGK